MADPLSPATEELGKRVRTFRLELHLTQEELAAAAEIDWTTVGKIERGLRNPNMHNLIRIARALGKDPSELLVGMTLEMTPQRQHRPPPGQRYDEKRRRPPA
ncbi:helix-turn-helix domain-containing protein [Rathayibacter soli]|uniref:helix-turn-helix domain-containing protein n=1 Tax=Rathayibacter soli TaxID=3144168 RepID=UPI0027E59751|nr:helix-turn-helix transcriptional regulator [Glaciibacter superstes]